MPMPHDHLAPAEFHRTRDGASSCGGGRGLKRIARTAEGRPILFQHGVEHSKARAHHQRCRPSEKSTRSFPAPNPRRVAPVRRGRRPRGAPVASISSVRCSPACTSRANSRGSSVISRHVPINETGRPWASTNTSPTLSSLRTAPSGRTMRPPWPNGPARSRTAATKRCTQSRSSG